MTSALGAREFQAEMQSLDGLLKQTARLADPAAQAHAHALVQAVLGLHGAGLARILEYLEEAGEAGRAALEACVGDEVVGGLLLLHGLHPLDVEVRVRQALEQVAPALRAHGGNVELLGVSEGVVRLRLHGHGDGRTSSAAAMRQMIEEAVYGRAPDAAALEIEDKVEWPTGNGRARVPLPVL